MTLRHEYQILNYFSQLEHKLRVAPLLLGGYTGGSGGYGGPPGGFIGYLPQRRVTFDTTEAATTGYPTPSGASLVHNLNRIRYRLVQLEGGAGTSLVVQEDGTPVASGVKVVNFTGARVEVTTIPSGVTVTINELNQQALLTIEGTLETNTGELTIPNVTGRTLVISKVYLRVGTAPTGDSIIADIHLDGTTIFTTQANRPEIAISGYTGQTTTIDVPNWTDGSYLTLDIDQVGSILPGSNLTAVVVYA